MSWSQRALGELEDAVAFRARASRSRASQLLEKLLDTADSLHTLAERGRMVPESGDPSVRELLVDSFRLIYHVRGSTVVILGLLHQRRDADTWLRG